MKKAAISVAEMLAQAFLQARAQQQEVLKRWNKVSYNLGPRVGASLLFVSIQQQGETDAVLRCIEDEFADPQRREKIDFVTSSYHAISVYWIGAVYEVLRLLRARNLLNEPNGVLLLNDFELLRIPLEKHEITKDREFTEPVTMIPFPPGGGETDSYTYDPKSPTRAHIMPSGLTTRGSLTWQAIDTKTRTARWIERRSLSDRLLDLWGG